ncbi:MAG: SCP2 sterol-binding domain-containing protein [Paracoccaceae bacterium]
MDEIAERIGRKLRESPFSGSLKFDCGDEGVIVLADGDATTADRATDCTLKISRDNLVKLLTGKLNPMMAMATGKLKLSGDPAVAMRLAKLIA